MVKVSSDILKSLASVHSSASIHTTHSLCAPATLAILAVPWRHHAPSTSGLHLCCSCAIMLLPFHFLSWLMHSPFRYQAAPNQISLSYVLPTFWSSTSATSMSCSLIAYNYLSLSHDATLYGAGTIKVLLNILSLGPILAFDTPQTFTYLFIKYSSQGYRQLPSGIFLSLCMIMIQLMLPAPPVAC